MSSIKVDYHATFDVDFKPVVEFVPAHDHTSDYYRLRLNPFDLVVYATRAQLVELAAAIAKGIIPPMEIPELKPITVQVQHPNIPEWGGARS